jgi:hypothetical protein
MNWMGLNKDPRDRLRGSDDTALAYWIERDLFEIGDADVTVLWELPQVRAILDKRRSYGGWDYPKKDYGGKSWGSDYRLLETFRQLRILVEKYGFDRRHPSMDSIVDFIVSFQSKKGDMRGILGNQYMPYYQGAITGLLVKAGYDQDLRVRDSLAWLLSMRQEDGGWIVPIQAVPPAERSDELWRGEPLEPDRSRPSSHMATGMVLRGFAYLDDDPLARDLVSAANLMASRFFTADKYNDRHGRQYWLKFQYPYWWTDLVSSIDSLSRLRLALNHERLKRGAAWFIENQAEDGLWETGYGKGRKAENNREWVGLAICRNLKRLQQS